MTAMTTRPCPLLDCKKAASSSSFSGLGDQIRLTTSMMQAYVAMRAGVNDLERIPGEPMLERLSNQEGPEGPEHPQ